MDVANPSLTTEAFNAHLLRGVIEATAPAGESMAEKHARAGAIFRLFEGFNPGDAVAAMIACHCIALQFVLTTAMRDASATHLEPKTRAGMRTSATAISKILHMWVTKLESMKQRDAAPVSETTRRTVPVPVRRHWLKSLRT